jgi:SagB-type dehydrogenase family enzyme
MSNPSLDRRWLKATDWSLWRTTESDQKRRIPPPPLEKPVPDGAARIDLTPPEALTVGRTPLIEIIRQRCSRRAYSDAALTLEELSFLLWATQGVRGTRDDGRNSLRTVPSGGARHPFETYLWINRVEGLTPGLYRYLPLEHQLCLLRAGDALAKQVVAACSGQGFAGAGAVTFFWTAIPYRTEWRYTVVASKIIAQDSGHLCQNLYLAAEAIGAGTCAIGAYDQALADALLGVDGEDEFVIYIAPVGKIA